jgi:hypothetical protein
MRNCNDDQQSQPDPGRRHLIDALAHLSVLYHARDKVVEDQSATCFIGSNNHTGFAQALLDRSLNVREDICTQRDQVRAAHPKSDFLTIPDKHFPSSYPYPSSVVTHFCSLKAANASTFYSAVLIMVSQFIVSIYALLPAQDVGLAAVTPASDQISVAVEEILMSVDYHLLFADPSVAFASGTSDPRKIYLLLPLRIAHKVLSQSESLKDFPQRLWLEDVMSLVRSRAMPWLSNDQIFGTR